MKKYLITLTFKKENIQTKELYTVKEKNLDNANKTAYKLLKLWKAVGYDVYELKSKYFRRDLPKWLAESDISVIF